jgi:hypothetical protein
MSVRSATTRDHDEFGDQVHHDTTASERRHRMAPAAPHTTTAARHRRGHADHR